MAIVRISGPKALDSARRLVRLPEPVPPRQALLRTVRDAVGEPLDEALVLFFPASQSFTGEEVVELQGHGGVLQASRLLEAVQATGVRAAGPGEFTRRAVENGRMSLDRAEAVCELALAETEAGLAVARNQFFGALQRTLGPLLAEVSALYVAIEASLDFPEEVPLPASLPGQARALAARCREVGATHRAGRALKEGIRIVLAGPPNAGKSSLFNRLAGESRALVDSEPGTTRDALEARIELFGIPCTLVDTAGLREGAGRIEALGIERAHEELERAGLILWVTDGSRAPDLPDLDDARLLRVWNKADLHPGGREGLRVSALTGEGMEGLREAVRSRVLGEETTRPGEWIVTHRRHAELLERAATAFERAGECSETGPLEMAGYELREGLDALEAIAGRGVREPVLDAIFSRFCIGK